MGGVGVIFREKNSEIYEKILIPFNLVFVRKKMLVMILNIIK